MRERTVAPAATTGPWLRHFKVAGVRASIELASLSISHITRHRILAHAQAELRHPSPVSGSAEMSDHHQRFDPPWSTARHRAVGSALPKERATAQASPPPTGVIRKRSRQRRPAVSAVSDHRRLRPGLPATAAKSGLAVGAPWQQAGRDPLGIDPVPEVAVSNPLPPLRFRFGRASPGGIL